MATREKWLPEAGGSENWEELLIVGLLAEASVRKQRGKRRPTIVELLDRAEAMRAAIECEGVNRAEVARREGLTRARVTQLLQLLNLRPGVRAEMLRLVQGGAKLSGRTLRALVRLPAAQQLGELRRAAQRADRAR